VSEARLIERVTGKPEVIGLPSDYYRRTPKHPGFVSSLADLSGVISQNPFLDQNAAVGA